VPQPLLGGRQGVPVECRGGEQDSRLDVRLAEMIPQRLDFGPADGRVLTPAGDQDTSVPRPAAHPALKLQQIASLRLRQGRAPMDAQLGHEEPDLAQLAHDENLEMLRGELRQFQHRSRR